MTYCKNCHKLSKDDDFCSHCGAAVWGENEVSNDAPISCDTMKDHTHDKVTYSTSERGEGVHIPEGYKPNDPTEQRRPNASNKNTKLGSGITKAVILLIVLKVISKVIIPLLERI